MSSTSFNLDVTMQAKPSSRVLKPPGGGHSDIFGSSDVRHNPPRPKNNQQNSSNMNAVMGTVDPNESLGTSKPENNVASLSGDASSSSGAENGGGTPKGTENKPAASDGQRPRVPPGGHSQGFW